MKNKKILVIEASSLLAGSQKVTLKILDSLSQRGFEIYAILKSDNELFDGYYKKFNTSRFVFNKIINKYFGTGDFSLSRLKVSSKIILLFSILFSNIQVICLAKKNNISTIYCYDPKGIVLCGLFAKLFNIKVIWHLHGKLTFGERVNKFLLRLAYKVIVPSESISNNLAHLRNDLNVVYNGFDFSLKNKSKSFQSDKKYKLIYIGTIVPNKGLHLIINKLIRSTIKEEIELNVLGLPVGDIGDNYKKYLLDCINNLPSNISVNFKGWVNNPTEYILNSNALLFSSVDECEIEFNGKRNIYKASEGLPTVLIESISLGVPVLAANTTGVAEIVFSEKFGVILDDICNCDFDLALRDTLKCQGFKPPSEFFEKFSINTMNDKINNIIKGHI
ncbi:glycosyltransferase [Photobacterium carnosum]|uniref:glycosyltransferase n=1 Tax=Photobacterium carnosum TaxID=2023717 RepID=UPI001E574F72|nr:glycosyltransferase [Photobacterium carnosum]MCD9546751.1 glycosyltransferase [Photobacterium carnosum]